MSVLYLLIIAALIVAIGFLIAFIWGVRTGQFDDTHTPAMRILLDGKAENLSNELKNKEPENGH